ncbi:hypothetical protein ACQJBY_008045 [Aegilops geniculata]
MHPAVSPGPRPPRPCLRPPPAWPTPPHRLRGCRSVPPGRRVRQPAPARPLAGSPSRAGSASDPAAGSAPARALPPGGRLAAPAVRCRYAHAVRPRLPAPRAPARCTLPAPQACRVAAPAPLYGRLPRLRLLSHPLAGSALTSRPGPAGSGWPPRARPRRLRLLVAAAPGRPLRPLVLLRAEGSGEKKGERERKSIAFR